MVNPFVSPPETAFQLAGEAHHIPREKPARDRCGRAALPVGGGEGRKPLIISAAHAIAMRGLIALALQQGFHLPQPWQAGIAGAAERA